MRRLFSRSFLFLAILASFLPFLYVRHQGGNTELMVLISGVVIFASAWLLERVLPYNRYWNVSRGDLSVDAISAGVLLGAMEPLMKWLVPLIVVAVYGLIGQPLTVFPVQAPYLVQVLLVTLVAEFFYYWAHRWHHRQRHLWWLHAMHHDSERLYTLNTLRFHPLNHMLNYLMGLLPLMLMGAPAEAILGYIALTQPALLLQHANLQLDSGWLNYIFSTNEVHRWHHSRKAEEGERNYGRTIMLWDQIFGTFLYRPGDNNPEQVGLYSQGAYPANAGYWHQLSSIFQRRCCRPI